MVDRELGGNGGDTAVLAGVVVPEQQIATIGTEDPARNVNVAEQPDDDDVLRDAAVLQSGRRPHRGFGVEEGDPLLAQQHDQPPMADHVQRLQ